MPGPNGSEGKQMVRRIKELGGMAAVLAACGQAAWAHPGHGVIPPENPAHWLEPVHAVPIALLAAALVALAFRRRRSRSE